MPSLFKLWNFLHLCHSKPFRPFHCWPPTLTSGWFSQQYQDRSNICSLTLDKQNLVLTLAGVICVLICLSSLWSLTDDLKMRAGVQVQEGQNHCSAALVQLLVHRPDVGQGQLKRCEQVEDTAIDQCFSTIFWIVAPCQPCFHLFCCPPVLSYLLAPKPHSLSPIM